MEIGLDYMQMRSHAQYIGLRWAGVLTLAAGILIAAMGIAYYGHFFALRAALADYPAHRDDTTLLGEDVAPAPASGRIVSARALLPGVSDAAIAELGFTPMPQEAAWPVGTQPPIQRLKVPKLGINMKQEELLRIGDEAVSGNYDAGADPEVLAAISAHPGERGAMWLFGPPGQGNDAFGSLTLAPELIAANEDVLIFVGNGDVEYAYSATHTDVIPRSELRPNSSGQATIHLAVPVPVANPDHLLVMSGQLVGVKTK